MDAYNLPKAVIPMIDLLDDLSNWYIRRSRSRFWKTEDDDDKNNAYHTLYFVLVNFCLLLSPFSPFLTEYLFRKLTGKESVHLEDYPKFDKELQDDKLESQMLELRELITTGLAIRAKAGIKVRQPLSSTKTTTMSEELKDILKDELNVKTIITSDSNTGIELDLDITPDLKSEGLAREVIRVVQNARKNADLNINDRINLNLITDSLELKESIESNKDLISRETLTKELSLDSKDQGFKEDVKFEDINLTIIIS
jgi:isoleucyl-tRNA synthetase